MQNIKVAVKINRLARRNFQSGGDKVDYYIIKALIEFGFIVDVYCNEYDEKIDLNINNIFDARKVLPITPYYLFILGENFATNKTILYVHENSRHFQIKYTRSKLANIMRKIFQPKHAKIVEEALSDEIEAANSTQNIIVPSSIVKNDILEFFSTKDENIFILPPPVEKLNIQSCVPKDNSVFTFGLAARGFANKGGWQVIFSSLLLKLLGYKFKVRIIYPFSSSVKSTKLAVKLMGLSKDVDFLEYCENMSEDFYSKIDCLIVASKREAFGLVAPEAMQFSIPIIANERCGIKDFIENNTDGLIYRVNKPVLNLFKKMQYVLNNREVCQIIGENAKSIPEKLYYEKFKENFSCILKSIGYLT